MGYRKYVIAGILALSTIAVKAQTLTFQQVDSTSYALYTAANWQKLADFGDKAVEANIDFPLLRLRMAFSNFMLGNYSGALIQYEHVLASDANNQTAHYYSYLCNSYLNRDAEGFRHLKYVDTTTLNNEKLSPFGLVKAGVETGVKVPGDKYRGNATYSRVSLSNRLGWRLVLDESVAYFSQPITFLPTATVKSTTDSQIEYYGKLTFSLSSNLMLIGAYHYFNTSYLQTTYGNNTGLIGLKYAGNYVDLQADVNFSNISGSNFMQYDGKLTTYPLGNLNLYTITTFSSAQGTTTQNIFGQLLGFKLSNKFWLEGSATFGKLDNYFEYDALYIYNAIDVTTFKGGATLFYQLNKHAQLFVNYTYEQKTDATENINYNQNSATGGFTWKF
jgi:hypothetical protein